MNVDNTRISIIVGVLIVLVSVFLDEQIPDELEIPLIIGALGLMVYAYFKDRSNDRKKDK